jgi:hypothetical protein
MCPQFFALCGTSVSVIDLSVSSGSGAIDWAQLPTTFSYSYGRGPKLRVFSGKNRIRKTRASGDISLDAHNHDLVKMMYM